MLQSLPPNPRILIWRAVSSKSQADNDKESLRAQERSLREWAATIPGSQVVDVLTVPGISRNYYNFLEFCQAAREQGCEAGYQLLDYCERRAFDVFACRDGSRFGRKQSIFNEVVDRIIDSGALIYTEASGWVDDQRQDIYKAMEGYAAATEIKRLNQKQKFGKAALFERGLPPQGAIPFTHKILRLPNGKMDKVVLDEAKRRMLDDAAHLLVDQRVGWYPFEKELFNQFGHGQGGRPYKHNTFYRLMHNPGFWGHLATNWNGKSVPNKNRTDMWVFDEHAPLPEGVSIKRNAWEPGYTGDQAERVQAELRRRRMSIRGTNRPQKSHMFSGLLLCGYCGYGMAYNVNSYRCRSAYLYRVRTSCDRRRSIREGAVIDWLNEKLREMQSAENTAYFIDAGQPVDQQQRVNQILADIAEVEASIRKAIEIRLAAPESLAAYWDEHLRALDRQLTILRGHLTETQRHAAIQGERVVAQTGYNQLREIGIENLWQQDSVTINQLLHKLFGNSRMVVIDREIVGIKRIN